MCSSGDARGASGSGRFWAPEVVGHRKFEAPEVLSRGKAFAYLDASKGAAEQLECAAVDADLDELGLLEARTQRKLSDRVDQHVSARRSRTRQP